MIYFVPLSAPDGCLQYYTEEIGSIESFNWRMESSPYPALTNYAICIKRHQPSLASYCGITFAAATQGDGKFVVWSLYVQIPLSFPYLLPIEYTKRNTLSYKLILYIMLMNTIRFELIALSF